MATVCGWMMNPGIARWRRSASTLSSRTASTRPITRSLYGCTIVFVGDDAQAVFALGAQQDLVGDRRCRAWPTVLPRRSASDRNRAASASRTAQHFPELVVRHRHRHRRATRRGVFDAAQTDVRVAAGDALVDRAERDVLELRLCGRSPAASSAAISTSNPTRRSGCDGSASTNGAPPSGSPAQRSTLGCAEATFDAAPASHRSEHDESEGRIRSRELE